MGSIVQHGVMIIGAALYLHENLDYPDTNSVHILMTKKSCEHKYIWKEIAFSWAP